MTTAYKGLDGIPVGGLGQVLAFLVRVRTVVNGLLVGKLNVTLDVTLTPNAASTAVSDPRIGGSSSIQLMALSANAAAEIGNGTIWWGSPGNQTVTLNHANNAQTDRNFRLTLIG